MGRPPLRVGIALGTEESLTHRGVIICLFLPLSALLTLCNSALGQCTQQWLPEAGIPGMNDSVKALTMWDPDGSGPRPPMLVAAGQFMVAGEVLATAIAAWDGTQWLALGSVGPSSAIDALIVLPSGELVAGGNFTSIGGVTARNVAVWNGSTWAPLGTGMTGGTIYGVRAFAIMPNGDLVAGGAFTSAGGNPARSIARWNGTAWSAFPTGPNPSTNGVAALRVLPGGDLLVAGSFTSTGGVAGTSGIARWDGATWSSVGGGIAGIVNALAMLPGGDIVAAGWFSAAGGVPANHIARWNGSTWSALGSGTTATIWSLAVLSSGDLIAGGEFVTIGGAAALRIARWDGTGWHRVGDGVDSGTGGGVSALLAIPSGELFAGGGFRSAGGLAALHIARWNGSSWSALGTGFDWFIERVRSLPTHGLVVGGAFTSAAGGPASHIVRRNGAVWEPVGGGMGPLFSAVYDMAELPNGDLIAVGDFSTAGGVPAPAIARWNGSTWSAMGTFNARIETVVTTPSGDLIAGGVIASVNGSPVRNLVRWDGQSWSEIRGGVAGATSYPGVHALLLLPGGDLVVGGGFNSAGSTNGTIHIARWTGSQWLSLGGGVGERVWALARLPNGDIVAGGAFLTAGGSPANRIARWDGTTWSPLGTGMNGEVIDLAVQDGDLIAGGEFTTAGGVPARNIARWNGSAWSPLDLGVNAPVSALAVLPNGDLAVAGSFTAAGSRGSGYFARYGCPTCYANCDGSTQQPALNVNDFICFQSRFAAQDLYADCDHTGTLNVNDFVCFQGQFAAGCP